MDDSAELAWRHYQEHCIQGRHHETQRASVSQYTIAIAAALSGLVGVAGIERKDIPLAAMVVILGLFGAVFAAKQYERFRYHMAQAKGFRLELQRFSPSLDVAAVKADTKARHAKEFPRLNRLRLHRFWVALHLMIALIGIALLSIAVVRPTT